MKINSLNIKKTFCINHEFKIFSSKLEYNKHIVWRTNCALSIIIYRFYNYLVSVLALEEKNLCNVANTITIENIPGKYSILRYTKYLFSYSYWTHGQNRDTESKLYRGLTIGTLNK